MPLLLELGDDRFLPVFEGTAKPIPTEPPDGE